MAFGILALFDDIAVLFDDVVLTTKISMEKTAWILWDDLAVNAEKASWFHVSRKISVLWSITKWSFINKIIILPIAFLSTFYFSFLLDIALILWAFYLSFEWIEKINEFILHKFFKIEHISKEIILTEEEKIKSAILTDFILSIEIVVIALWAVTTSDLYVRFLSVSLVAFLSVILVYWFVGLLLKIDDFGVFIIWKSKKWDLKYRFWNFLVSLLPYIVKFLAIVWTLAMLIVAWWILTHKIYFIHNFYHIYVEHYEKYLFFMTPVLFDFILWFILWYIVFFLFDKIFHKIILFFRKKSHKN